jgi:hypothetical protein
MPILIVNNNAYAYPDPGQEPGWGESATAWAQAVTDVLNTLVAPGDILETNFTIGNNVSSFTNINGLAFDGAVVRAANITYSVYRTTTAMPSGTVEQGTILLTYDNAGSVGNKWKVSIQSDVTAGVTFACTDSGQVQYISTDMTPSTGYTGTIVFKARTLSQ